MDEAIHTWFGCWYCYNVVILIYIYVDRFYTHLGKRYFIPGKIYCAIFRSLCKFQLINSSSFRILSPTRRTRRRKGRRRRRRGTRRRTATAARTRTRTETRRTRRIRSSERERDSAALDGQTGITKSSQSRFSSIYPIFSKNRMLWQIWGMQYRDILGEWKNCPDRRYVTT